MTEGALQKPPRDPGTTERMIRKSQEIRKKEISRRRIGLIVVIVLIVAAAYVVFRLLSGTVEIAMTK